MLQINLVRLFSFLALAFWTSTLSAVTITYEVGTCMPGLPSFPTITAALAATPAANVVMVCPGTYREQVQITHPVTLEGVSTDGSARAIIASPTGGVVTNTTNDFGAPLAVQLWVNNAFGSVNISDLTVDASGNGVPAGTFVVGIFYHNSSGTVNRVVARKQSGNANGFGIYAEGGSSNPFVTIENSSVHDYDSQGITVDTNSATRELTAVIKGNEITTSKPNFGGVVALGSSIKVTNNLIVNPPGSSGFSGIYANISTGAITGNTSVHGAFGIIDQGRGGGVSLSSGVSVISNEIVGALTGIFLFEVSIEEIHRNSITDSSVGIEFDCFADPNVQSNIITDADKALNDVPSAVATSNTYFNVGKIRTDGCGSSTAASTFVNKSLSAAHSARWDNRRGSHRARLVIATTPRLWTCPLS